MRGGAHSAVVLSLGVNGLGIVRALGREKIKVYGLYKNPDSEVGRYSKYVNPIQFRDKNDLLNQLLLISKYEKVPPVLFPSSDEYIDFMVENNNILKEHYQYNLPRFNTLEELMDKQKTIDLLEKHNIAYPKSICGFSDNGNTSIEQKMDKLTMPVIVKPRRSWDLEAVNNEKNIIFEDKDSFISYIKRIRSLLDKILIQEIIPHDDSDVYYCTGYYDKESRLLAVFTAQKLRQYLPKYGITSFAVSRTVDKIKDQAEAFLSSIEYKGLFDIEFMYDHRDDTYKFIEVNARTHLANSHSDFCGVNLPFIAYRDLTGSAAAEMPLQSEDIYWLYFQMDKGSCYRKLKKGEISLIRWLRSLLSARSFAIWAKDDPAPFWKSCK